MLKKLKNKTEYCLKNFPETRNSDVTLTLKIWKEFYSSMLLKREKDGLIYVALNSIYDLPREDNVKRIRAKFNENGLYLTDSEEVARKRKLNMDMWREFINNN